MGIGLGDIRLPREKRYFRQTSHCWKQMTKVTKATYHNVNCVDTK